VVREATPADHGACLGVIRRAFRTVADDLGIGGPAVEGRLASALTSDAERDIANAPRFPADWDEQRFAAAIAGDGTLLVAHRAGRLVGCVFVGRVPADAAHWVLKRLAVLPDARHLGIGRALVGAATERARRAGATRLTLRIIAENEVLGRWYTGLEFCRRSELQHPGWSFTVHEYELRLVHAPVAARPVDPEAVAGSCEVGERE
jgi:ribosomal protein S18 acetylase RimI-like enzyme